MGIQIKLLSLFSGIGAPEKALKNLGIDFELVGFSEIDKYAAKAYCAIHDVDESMNMGDITKIDEQALPKDIDLITYGFPCQDISVAGKGKGLFNEDGTQTRSGLFFDALRIIEATQPRIAIAENVKNLTGKKFKEQFELILNCLETAGYNNYWKVLNAKDYGIPQNRERVFIVSIRKDVDDGSFEFPKPFPLELRLKDMLEEQVDEKFYLSDEQMGKIRWGNINSECTAMISNQGTQLGKETELASTLLARDYKGFGNQAMNYVIEQVAQLYPNSGNPQAGRVYDADGISPAMDTCQGGNRMPKIAIREATKKGAVVVDE